MKYVLTLFILLHRRALFAQLSDPVQWKGKIKTLHDNKVAYFLSARLDSGWHLYSQHLPDGGPVKKSVQLSANDQSINPLSEWVETGRPETSFDSNFQINVTYYSREVIFAAVLPQLAAGAPVIASVNYMVCTDEDCLPPTGQNAFSRKKLSGYIFTAFRGRLAALLIPCVFPIVPLG